MKQNISGKIDASESINNPKSSIVKSGWKTPRLIEIDNSKTNGSGGTADDGTTQDAQNLS